MAQAATKQRYLRQPARLVALILQLLTFYGVYVYVTGKWEITAGGEAMWILAAAEWGVLSLLGAPWFRPPRDAFAVAITALATLVPFTIESVPFMRPQLALLRDGTIIFSVALLIAASVAMLLEYGGKFERLRRLARSLADRFSAGALVFGAIALISIFGFYEADEAKLGLTALWFGFALVRPYEWALLTALRLRDEVGGKPRSELVGRVRRVDHPDIVRIALEPGAQWNAKGVYLAALPGGRLHHVLPLNVQVQNDEVIATALCCGAPVDPPNDLEAGDVVEIVTAGEERELVKQVCQSADDAEIVGITTAGSEIGRIQFEVIVEEGINEGSLVCCTVGKTCVYFQVLGARTAEESFDSSPRGLLIAEAVQLGSLENGHFKKFPWLPPINSPVYRKAQPPAGADDADTDTIRLGKIPDSDLPVTLRLRELVEYHCAVLGVTGTGKTEVALDLARSALGHGAKVICVDLTGEYEQRLADIPSDSMGVPPEYIEDFDAKMFETDVGGYSKSGEKIELESRLKKLQATIDGRVDEFLRRDDIHLAHFTLNDVVNTKASLRITEMFLSSIMAWARKNRKLRQILIILEEAHTIIPEVTNAFDKDMQRVVSKIGQIALQGRKYGVGLMVVSQRTALVSKTILSQCHTFLIHSLIDQTSLDFLQNVIGREYIRLIPNLMPLQLIAAGKAVQSERPILTQREWSEEKAAASERLNRTALEPAKAEPILAGEEVAAASEDIVLEEAVAEQDAESAASLAAPAAKTETTDEAEPDKPHA